jgi:hypothetical protein
MRKKSSHKTKLHVRKKNKKISTGFFSRAKNIRLFLALRKKGEKKITFFYRTNSYCGTSATTTAVPRPPHDQE